MRTVGAQNLLPCITRIPSTMHSYEIPHQSSAPIFAKSAVSLTHSGIFLMHEAGDPRPRNLGSSRDERRAGIKRAREEIFQRDAFECKRPVPNYAAIKGTHVSPASGCIEKHDHCTDKKFGERNGLTISSVYCQNVESFLIEEKINLNSSLIELTTDNHLGDSYTRGFDNQGIEENRHNNLQRSRQPSGNKRNSCGGAHNHAGNRDNINMRSHFCRGSLDMKDRNSVSPHCFSTAFAEKKALGFQEEDHAVSPGQAQRGARPNSKVLIDVTNKFKITTSPVGVKRECIEDDVHRLTQRHKQIEFGKNTLGYERYIELIPKSKRKHQDPITPNPKQVCSKRSWDGQIRKWRRLLHDYDPPAQDGEELAEDFALLKSNQKHEKLELNKDSKTVDRGLPCRASQRQESRKGEATGGVANKDVGLSIYEDWMDI